MWKRKVRVEAYSDRQYKKLIWTTEELRVDFVFKGVVLEAVDTCAINIFNTSRDTIVTLTNAPILYVRLFAGYEDEEDSGLMLLFSGIVNNTWSRRVPPNNIITLYCLKESAIDILKVIPHEITQRDTTLLGALNGIAKAAGYTSGVNVVGLSDDILGALVPRRSFTGSTKKILDSLAREFQFYYTAKKDALRVSPIMKAEVLEYLVKNSKGIVHKLELVRTKELPELGCQKANISYVLSPSICAGDVIDIGDFIDKEGISYAGIAAGQDIFTSKGYTEWATLSVYMVQEITHIGSNYTDTWETKILGVRHHKTTVGA